MTSYPLSPAERPPLLDIRGLSIGFDSESGRTTATESVDLHVNHGEAVTIVGESGSGKSVTCRCVLGLLPEPPARRLAGQISFDGATVYAEGIDRRHELRDGTVSMVFQDPSTALNPVMTVGEQMVNVYLRRGAGQPGAQTARRRRDRRRHAQDRAVELFEKMRLPEATSLLRRYPFELSGGMRQRVVIALSLVTTPRLLLADEPGTALDVTVQSEINRELLELVRTEGISLVYVTHNLGVAKLMGTRTYVMRHGRIVEEGPTEAMFDAPREPYTRELLAAVPRLI